MKAYTIFLGDELFQNVIDDMNSEGCWSVGGMLWLDRKLAESCIVNLRSYDFEKGGLEFRVVEVDLKHRCTAGVPESPIEAR